MNMRWLSVAVVCVSYALLGFCDYVDPRTRTYLLPTRVVWTSGTQEKAAVGDASVLLSPKLGQVPEGRFLSGSGCRMENKGEPASLLVDFGRELHGGIKLMSGGPSAKGLKVRVRFGESVAEAMAELGERGACNDHAIRDSVIDLPWLGTREIGETGFRFVRIDLVTKGVLSLESIEAVSIMRPLEQLGAFRSSDERLNKIWVTAARTLHLCTQNFIWDGIKRDRLVWMGDMHPELMSLMAVFGPQDVLPNSLDYMKATTPANAWMNGMPSYTLWWIRCQYDWYFYTGDAAYLKKQQQYLRGLFDNLLKHIDKEGRCATPSGFLDWPTQHNKPAVSAGMQALIVNAFACGEKMADVLKDEGMKQTCKEALVRLRSIRPDPAGSKQAAALLALSGLRDTKEMMDGVLAKDGVQGVSTFYGYYMLEAMAKAGEYQTGINTIRDYWGAMLDMGATSFWEDFNVSWTNNAFRIDEMPVVGKKDIHGDYGEFCYKGFRHSLCHGWSSGPAAWLIHHVLGIQPVEPGCSVVSVKPHLGDLSFAEGSYPTPKGVIRVRHERKSDGTVASSVTAPDGIRVLRE